MENIIIPCVLCPEKEGTSDCHTCENVFCEDCLEDHRHCIDCGGTGVYEWEVRKDNMGNLDYLHGKPTGQKKQELCKRCEGTGLEM